MNVPDPASYKINKRGELEIHTSPKKNKAKKNAIPAEYFNLGFYLIVPILVGILLGTFLDNRFGTDRFFVLIFIFFGTISIFYNLYKLIHTNGSAH